MKISLFHYEYECYDAGHRYVAGVDEAGRGAWAGPIVAAAVIFPKDILETCAEETRLALSSIRDSKKLTPKKREELYDTIITYAFSFAVAEISEKDIDQNGIQWANVSVMTKAVQNLSQQPDYVLSDGYIKPEGYKGMAMVKGDSKVLSIAAASILAKVARDKIMAKYSDIYSFYGFDKHKGYGTSQHHQALKDHGPCTLHRKSFRPISLMIK